MPTEQFDSVLSRAIFGRYLFLYWEFLVWDTDRHCDTPHPLCHQKSQTPQLQKVNRVPASSQDTRLPSRQDQTRSTFRRPQMHDLPSKRRTHILASKARHNSLPSTKTRHLTQLSRPISLRPFDRTFTSCRFIVKDDAQVAALPQRPLTLWLDFRGSQTMRRSYSLKTLLTTQNQT